MQGVLRQAHQGFLKTLAGSFILHVIVIAAALLYVGTSSRRLYFTPVYTVSIVEAPRKVKHHGRAKPSHAARRAKPAAVKPEVKKEAVKVPLPVKERHKPKAVPVKKAVAKPAVKEAAKPPPPKKEAVAEKPKVSVNEAIERIAKDVKEKDDRALVSSSIEALKKKQAADDAAARTRIDEIKKELERKESEKKEALAAAAAAAAAAPKNDAPAEQKKPPASSGGLTKENLEAKYPEYYSTIHDKVQDEWIYPEGLSTENISIIVSIRVGRDGNLVKSWLEESSGNPLFDVSLLNAIKKASPFPPLPKDFTGEYLEMGIRFCPSCKDKD